MQILQQNNSGEEQGDETILAKSRWCFLKRKGNFKEKQSFKLKEQAAINPDFAERLIKLRKHREKIIAKDIGIDVIGDIEA